MLPLLGTRRRLRAGLTCTVGCLALLAGAALPELFPRSDGVAAAEKGVTAETVAYKGWKNNLRLSNGDAELIVTLDVGPRILSYRLSDGQNVFKEYPDQLGKAGESEWRIRGGHRLSVAPEDPKRSYAPDNGPVAYKVLDKASGLVRLTAEPDEANGIQKELDVQLADKGSRVKVVHRIKNVGDKPIELSPWAVTALAPGGVEIIPQPPSRPRPADPSKAKSGADYAPTQTIVFWPYFSFHNQGWNFGPRYVTLWPSTVKQGAKYGPTKAGVAHRQGWVGYLNDGTLFVKRFDYEEGKTYPDNGCSLETYANPDMLDIESLGPLVKLSPGAVVEHVETWDLVSGVGSYVHQFEIDKVVVSKIPPK
jgi:hypothetical protein